MAWFSLVSGIMQAGSQIGTGIATNITARDLAKRAQKQAAEAREDERRKGRAIAGAQRAGFAKAGVEVSAGTPLDVLAKTHRDTETNALRAAFAHEQRAADLKSMGRSALTQSIAGAATTILGSAGKYATDSAVTQIPERMPLKKPIKYGKPIRTDAPVDRIKEFGRYA